ncbi:Nn.00g054260.m01.CDS01 [Neocucurbitaria sp. VM-36]
MTVGWNLTKAALEQAYEALRETQFEVDDNLELFEEYEAALADKELELESWRTNSAGTIHALQRQIEDLQSEKEHLRADLEASSSSRVHDTKHHEQVKFLRGVIGSRNSIVKALEDENAELIQENELIVRDLRDVMQECEELYKWKDQLVGMISAAMWPRIGLQQGRPNLDFDGETVVGDEAEGGNDEDWGMMIEDMDVEHLNGW